MRSTPLGRLPGALVTAACCWLLALPAASGQATAGAAPPAPIKCVPGVHMIVARASEEAPGPGFLGKLAQDVVANIPGSDFVAVDYPAKLADYTSSQQAGLVAMTGLINDYVAACPNNKIVLMGYSQGAHVAADIVCGASELTFNQTAPLSQDKSSKIAAVVLMGDPSRNASAPFDQGTATKDGVFPRKNVAGCGNMASRMVSFCNANDMFCDSGTDLGVHLSYVETNGPQALQFVMSKASAPLPAPASGPPPAAMPPAMPVPPPAAMPPAMPVPPPAAAMPPAMAVPPPAAAMPPAMAVPPPAAAMPPAMAVPPPAAMPAAKATPPSAGMQPAMPAPPVAAVSPATSAAMPAAMPPRLRIRRRVVPRQSR